MEYSVTWGIRSRLFVQIAETGVTDCTSLRACLDSRIMVG